MNVVNSVKAGWIRTTDVFALIFFFRENLFEELNEDNGRMEVKEDCQWKRDPLDDDPRHESVEVGLHQIGPHFLNLKRCDKPLCKVEEEEEDCDLSARLGKFFLRWKNL